MSLDRLAKGNTISTFDESAFRNDTVFAIGSGAEATIRFNSWLINELALLPGIEKATNSQLETKDPTTSRYYVYDSEQQQRVQAFLNEALNHTDNFKRNILQPAERKLTWNFLSLAGCTPQLATTLQYESTDSKNTAGNANRAYAYTAAIANGIVQSIEQRIEKGESLDTRAMQAFGKLKGIVSEYIRKREEDYKNQQKELMDKLDATISSCPPGGMVTATLSNGHQKLLNEVIDSLPMAKDVTQAQRLLLTKFCAPVGSKKELSDTEDMMLMYPSALQNFISEVVEKLDTLKSISDSKYSIPVDITAHFNFNVANIEDFILKRNHEEYEKLVTSIKGAEKGDDKKEDSKEAGKEVLASTIPATVFGVKATKPKSPDEINAGLIVAISKAFVKMNPTEAKVAQEKILDEIPLWAKMITQDPKCSSVILKELRQRMKELKLDNDIINNTIKEAGISIKPELAGVELESGNVVGADRARSRYRRRIQR